jgi:hypothetical protein
VNIMNRALRSTALAVGLLAAAVSIQAQSPACQDVRFSDEVLNRFPGAPAACLDVISRDGQEYAVFKAKLVEARGDSVRVKVKKADGTYGETKTIKTKPGRQVLIDGKPAPVSELAPNQEITAYVRVDRPMIALAPAAETEPVDAEPMAAPVRVAEQPSMPHTASPIEGVGLLGQFCLALGLVLMMMRKRRK